MGKGREGGSTGSLTRDKVDRFDQSAELGFERVEVHLLAVEPLQAYNISVRTHTIHLNRAYLVVFDEPRSGECVADATQHASLRDGVLRLPVLDLYHREH